MALFEFEDGRLVPAQFGYPVAQDLGPDLVDAICQQVLQIVSRPLFPVTWRDMTGQDDQERPRLTALDVSGQIVSVEILKELDSETLITSLSRLAEVASISWSDLAAEYPSGPDGFRTGWAQFRDSMPPAVGPGPRLIMVAGDIDPSVRPALSVLATSGVEVHLMNLRQMSNGRLFLDVNAVGPRLYGHAPQLLASAVAAPELAAATEQAAPLDDRVPAESAIPVLPEESAEASNDEDSETPTTRPTPKVAPHLREVFTYPMDEEPPAPFKPAAEEAADEQSSDEAVEASAQDDELQADEQAGEQPSSEDEKPRWERPAHMRRRATRRAREESAELNDGGATDAATASSVDRSDESPEVTQARAEGLPVLGRDEVGLCTLAEILGQDTPLVARSELGLPADLVLAANGAISGAGLTYPSLDTLLTARGLGHIDAWGQVRIGDRLGPTLAEALDEINREIVREYAQVPRGTHSAKH